MVASKKEIQKFKKYTILLDVNNNKNETVATNANRAVLTASGTV